MVRKLALGLGLAASALAAVGAANLYQRYATETVPYATVASIGDVELRRYPASVIVQTVAPDQREAFGRLFRYVGGANQAREDVSMTTPVEMDGGGAAISSTPVELAASGGSNSTTPAVETDEVGGEGGVRMAFYLPPQFDADSAPVPTADDVEVVAVPARTLAVRRFSGLPSERRIEREREQLVQTLDEAEVPVRGDPFFLGYDAPWTLPFLRRNEVAVEVEAEG